MQVLLNFIARVTSIKLVSDSSVQKSATIRTLAL